MALLFSTGHIPSYVSVEMRATAAQLVAEGTLASYQHTSPRFHGTRLNPSGFAHHQATACWRAGSGRLRIIWEANADNVALRQQLEDLWQAEGNSNHRSASDIAVWLAR